MMELVMLHLALLRKHFPAASDGIESVFLHLSWSFCLYFPSFLDVAPHGK